MRFYSENNTRLMACAALAVLSAGWLWKGGGAATELAAYAGAATVIIGAAAWKSLQDRKPKNGNGS